MDIIVGKSTFLRQLILLQGKMFSATEKESFKSEIFKNCRKNFIKILDAIKRQNLGSKIEMPEFEVSFKLTNPE